MSTPAIVLHPYHKHKPNHKGRTPQACLEEAVGLAQALALEVRGFYTVPLSEVRPSSLLGKGTLEAMAETVQELEAQLVIVNTHLSPVQQRNLEKALNCKVIDRTALILEIFGERAQTREGILQVELAALNYQKGRLVRSWTHLERQRGGFGFTGGPGESQIELDRRIIRDRILKIKGDLKQVVRTRTLHRKNRHEIPYPMVALVGYTNAGKSTLFNSLTQADAFAADALFATLDPTIRRFDLAGGTPIMMSDTVGFISDLPTELVAAFRATLEEVCEADVLLHVRDASHPDTVAQRHDVMQVLSDLLGKNFDVPIIEVMNKQDLIQEGELPPPPTDANIVSVNTSALHGTGIAALQEVLRDVLSKRLMEEVSFTLPYTAGKELAWLHANNEVITHAYDDDGNIVMRVRFSSANRNRFAKMVQHLNIKGLEIYTPTLDDDF
jgi:GTP-binding protein HflX